MESNINPNKFISKLPIKIDLLQIPKKCKGIILLNQIKTRLVDSVYSNFTSDILVQTFLYLFNVIGAGIYVHIKTNKLKDFNIFQNIELIQKIDYKLIKHIQHFIEKNIKYFEGEVILFINFLPKPVLFKKGYEPYTYYNERTRVKLKHHNYPFYFPIVSFSSGYKMFDFSVPLFKINVDFEETDKLLFIFEKSRIELGVTKSIYNKILEYKSHPFYKGKKLDFILVDSYFKGKQIIGETNIIIKDPNNPIFLEQLVLNNKKVITIESSDFFSWYDELINIPKWKYNNWIEEFDKFVNSSKIVKENKKNIKEKSKIGQEDYFINFLNHLSENFRRSSVQISPYIHINKLTQMDYNKFFNILEKNLNLIQCWSYRLNPYFLLLDYLKTNHYFVPSFIKLCSLTFGEFNNLFWLSEQKSELDMLYKLLNKNKLKKIHLINNLDLTDDNLFLEKSCYFIEFPFKLKNLSELENEHLDNLDLINIFLDHIKIGSKVIIKLFTFRNSRTKIWIQLFQKKFESIKIIKNDWFEPYMPFRYLIGINAYKHKPEPVILDLDMFEKDFFDKETANLELIFKYIHSEAIVETSNMNNKEEIKEWLNKYIITV
jgi:hypothetical protein